MEPGLGAGWAIQEGVGREGQKPPVSAPGSKLPLRKKGWETGEVGLLWRVGAILQGAFVQDQ